MRILSENVSGSPLRYDVLTLSELREFVELTKDWKGNIPVRYGDDILIRPLSVERVLERED